MASTVFSYLRNVFISIFILSSFIYAKDDNSTINLTGGWFLQSSQKITDKGEAISLPGYQVKDWMPATVPTTVMAALVKNNVYKDLFMGNNLLTVDKEQFKKPWWFRTEFTLPNNNLSTVLLELNGIIIARMYGLMENCWLIQRPSADHTGVLN